MRFSKLKFFKTADRYPTFLSRMKKQMNINGLETRAHRNTARSTLRTLLILMNQKFWLPQAIARAWFVHSCCRFMNTDHPVAGCFTLPLTSSEIGQTRRHCRRWACSILIIDKTYRTGVELCSEIPLFYVLHHGSAICASFVHSYIFWSK